MCACLQVCMHNLRARVACGCVWVRGRVVHLNDGMRCWWCWCWSSMMIVIIWTGMCHLGRTGVCVVQLRLAAPLAKVLRKFDPSCPRILDVAV